MARAKRQFIVAVVDDDAGTREAIESLLNSAGFRTSGYGSAEMFLCSRSARSAGCLVLDLRLPGMSGLDLYRKLIEERISVPALLLTADNDHDGRLRAEALAAGMLGVLHKPFDGDALLHFVQEVLDTSG
jgi:FixJ family two-component response regulator